MDLPTMRPILPSRSRLEQTPMNNPRCAAAHAEDPTPCQGPHDAVTALDAHGAGAAGCEHHAARLLSSLDGGRVHCGSAPGAAIRVFKAAAGMPPFLCLKQGRA